ncbi:MAG: aminotransferase class V-fold PLP-dependent enzyme [Fimbriimonadaceae bacterium]|nr:aminotransferase class V-fold PLP-dependent enzyme [Fimbriimonadaceae bacterium]
MVTRRTLIATGLAGIAFRNETLDIVGKWIDRVANDPLQAAQDEDFWMQIQEAFTLDRTMINLNNGGVSPSPRVVQEAMRRYLEYSNQAPSYFMWRHLEPQIESVRRRLANTFGCDAEEIAITRNASESLENCLFGFDLKPGDEVLTTSLDYPRMITTIQQRERREGIRMVQVSVPHKPNSPAELTKAIEGGITPKTKLILFSHVSFLNGLIFPSAQVCDLGKRHGIPVIVDGAHAFAQIPSTVQSTQAEYYGVSLHKWLLAPIGTGMLHVKKANIGKLWSLMASGDKQVDDIRKFEEIGTHPAANHNAIAEALTFHELIGQERKTARFLYLRKRWTDRLSSHPKVQFHTNLDPSLSCALCTVGIEGIEQGKLAEWLWSKHGIFVTTIAQPEFSGIRVSPNVYTTVKEIDLFAKAMLQAATEGIG